MRRSIRGGSLLQRRLGEALTRVGDLSSAYLEFLFEIGTGLASASNACLRFGRVKLATSRLALCLFCEQDHLHRRAGPPCWSYSRGPDLREDSTQPKARVRAWRVGSDQRGDIKILFTIVWRGAQMSNVDHRALLCIFGAEHKTARRPVRRRRIAPSDLSPLGGA